MGVLFCVLIWRAEVEVSLQASAMVLVWMTQEEGVNVVIAGLGILVQPLSEHSRHIWRFILWIICGFPDVDIDKDLPAAGQLNQRHVPIVHGKIGH